MDFPITVNSISYEDLEPIKKPLFGNCGDMVGVRPVSDEYENKTLLGILLGDAVIGSGCFLEKEGVLRIVSQRNPAIFVPELNKIIFGYESWWGQIESVEELHQITDEDINNVWYVKALADLMEKEGEHTGE